MDIPKVKNRLAAGETPAEIAEQMQCPVATIESFVMPKEPAKSKAAKRDMGEEAEAANGD